MSKTYATVVLILVLLSSVFQNLAQLLATSRFAWALARESALPFSSFFKVISKGRIPYNATWAVVIIMAPALMLLRFSQAIFTTVLLEGAGWATIAAYFIPVAIYVMAPRDALQGDGRGEWSLRRMSKPLALAGCFFCTLFLIVVSFPTDYPIDTSESFTPYVPVQ